ncbi:MAG: hypothetical protein R2748_08220 [Bryobacterales bacterium]
MLRRSLPKAYRRPVTPDEVAHASSRYMTAHSNAATPFEESVKYSTASRADLAAVLVPL